jgi:hypothetical protein
MLSLPAFARPIRHGELILGRVGPTRFSSLYLLPPVARAAHMYVVGKTGKGKSRFLQYLLFQDVAAGRGCGVVDPHADLISDLLSLLITRGVLDDLAIRERLMYLDPARKDYVIPFNVLTIPGEPYEIAQNVIEAFRRTWPESLAEAPNFANNMLHAVLLLIQSQLTLVELPRLLVDREFREMLLTRSGDPDLTSFFHDRYDRWGREAPLKIESLLNKATAITMNPHLKRMLGQRENHLDFRRIMDRGEVLLADLGHCDEESQRLIGNLITTGMEQAAFSRRNIPSDQRRPFYLYIDEFQDFSANTGSVKTLSKILSGARKFGLHLTIAHQNLSQLSERMKGAVIGNVWTKVIFGISEEDAYEFARFVALGNLDPMAIKREAQTETQHPVYSSLPEQLNEWATTLANQRPRQATVRDYEGKTVPIWTIPVQDSQASGQKICQASLTHYGIDITQLERNRQELEPEIEQKISVEQEVPVYGW